MADGTIIIDTKLDNSGVENGLNKLSSVANKGALAIGSALTVATGVLTKFGTSAIKTASDLQEVQNVVDVTFGKNANKIYDWANKASMSFGMSKLQAEQFTGTLGAMMKSMGLTDTAVVDMSTSMTGLAGDFASFYNLPIEEAFAKIRSGISGETEPLKQLGINMSVANLEAYALSQGITKSYQSMTQAEQATLRYNYLMNASKDAQGDFARTSDSLANQLRIAQLNLSSLGAEIGELLIPVAQECVKNFNTLTTKLRETFKSEEIQESIRSIATAIGELITKIAEFVSEHIDDFLKGFQWILENANSIAAGIIAIVTALKAMSAATTVLKLIDAFNKAKAATEGLTVAQWLLNSSLLANPIVLIVGLVAGLVAAFIYLWNTSEGFRNFWIGLWESIKEVTSTVVDWICSFFTDTIPSAFNAVVDFFKNNWQGILMFLVNPFVGGFKLLYDNCESFRNFITNSLNSIISFFTQTIPQFVSSIITWISEIPNKVAYGIGYLNAMFIKGCSDAYNTFMNWCVSTYNTVVQYFTNMYNSIVNIISNLPGAIWNWLVNAYNTVVTWGSNLVNAGYNAAVGLVNSVVNTISSIPSHMLSIGRNIVQGLWNGIVGAKNWLISKVSGFVNSIVEGFKDGLGIHSPSRVMRDMVGIYIPQGIGVGIDKEMPNLQSQIDGNLNNLYSQLKGTVDIETAKVTTQVVASSNLSLSSSDKPIEDNNSNIQGVTSSIKNYYVDGKEFLEVLAPYMDEVMDEWRTSR